MEKVPSKTNASRHTNTWIISKIKRAIRRKQTGYKKARRNNIKKHRDRYKQPQKEVQSHVRRAKKSYLEDTVSNGSRENSKKVWSFAKSTGQEFTGVTLLKNKGDVL